MRRLLILCLALGGCDAIPKDTSGTLERVRADHVLRVGIIAGSGTGTCPDQSGPFLSAVGRATGAEPRMTTGPAEPLLNALRRGELDIVLGEVAHDSPWATDVSIIAPLARCPDGVDYAAIARNGENRWVMLLEDAGRAVRGEGASR
jgi:hypothetical protein